MRLVGCALVAILLTLPGSARAAKTVGYDKVVAVVVGISKYKAQDGWERLPNATKDARAFEAVMKKRGLSKRKKTLFTLYDRQATEKGIVRTMRKAIGAARSTAKASRTLLVFYYAGHGRKGDSGQGYLVPYGAQDESDYVSMATLRDWASVKNGVRHQLFVLAACYGGSVFRSDFTEVKRADVERPRRKDLAFWLQNVLGLSARRAIVAGRADQRMSDGGARGSLFGQAVVRAFTKHPQSGFAYGDVDRDGCVTDLELAFQVQSYGREPQTTPYMAALADDEGGAAVAFCDDILPDPGPAPAPVGARRADAAPEQKTPAGMVRVPGGPFFMGCNEKVDKGCFDDEKPGRTVQVPEFFIDRTEVSVAAYRACVKAGGCTTKGLTEAETCTWDRQGMDEHPISCVDWSQADAYCRSKGQRLPTEQEWEKAARGTDGRTYPWGNTWNAAAANIDGQDDGFAGTSPIDGFPAGASPYGALNMSGNVWEWTASWYSHNKTRAIRGGSWLSTARYARASSRLSFAPDGRFVNLGFRCAHSH